MVDRGRRLGERWQTGTHPHSVSHPSALWFRQLLGPGAGSVSSGGGLVGHAGVALLRGSVGDFQLHARLLLIHQHLRRQAPAKQAGLERGETDEGERSCTGTTGKEPIDTRSSCNDLFCCFVGVFFLSNDDKKAKE